MNKDSNAFTFIFATVMVVVVGTVLAAAAIGLKPFQAKNMEQEKMQNILAAIRVDCSREDASGLFAKYLKDQVVLNYDGALQTGNLKAFDVDVLKENRSLKPEKRNYPLFLFNKDGKNLFVVPVVGKGLWGPIWGFLAFEEDFNTVFGATFAHKSETPGLGSEINEKWFQEKFINKKILDAQGKYVSIRVVKGGANPEDLHGVDAITGGTITSNGVSEMLERTLRTYFEYSKTINKPVENVNNPS